MRYAAIAAHFLMCNALFLVLAIAAWENGHLRDALTHPVMLGAFVTGSAIFATTMWLNRSRAAAP